MGTDPEAEVVCAGELSMLAVVGIPTEPGPVVSGLARELFVAGAKEKEVSPPEDTTVSVPEGAGAEVFKPYVGGDAVGTVVDTANVLVCTTVLSAGQLVTVSAQDVTITSVVEYRVAVVRGTEDKMGALVVFADGGTAVDTSPDELVDPAVATDTVELGAPGVAIAELLVEATGETSELFIIDVPVPIGGTGAVLLPSPDAEVVTVD